MIISASSPTNLKITVHIPCKISPLLLLPHLETKLHQGYHHQIEHIQRKATKFTLNDYTNDYKQKLDALQMLYHGVTLWFGLYDTIIYISDKMPPSCSKHNQH